MVLLSACNKALYSIILRTIVTQGTDAWSEVIKMRLRDECDEGTHVR